ncbi:MAG: GAF domain-containing protein [Anaerolineales bacterium]|nr:GAF domain-containing protein [Anaerolineales bacterium]
MDPTQIEASINLEKALRRANLLAAAAEVSQNITHILDIDELLPKTVDIICDAYGFYYAGVFLIDAAGEFAVLRAGRGDPGRIMIENHHKLAVGGNSMIGACTALNQARISLDVDTEKVWYPNPVLPDTRSEMALPLAIGDRVIGAVTVQSTEGAAFSDEDVSSLQAMANQLAIAIDNAYKRRELEETHAELLRAKTFEAIATATGDAIHWIGNKAEPIGASAERIRSDFQLLVCAIANLLQQDGQAVSSRPLAQMLLDKAATLRQEKPDLADLAEKANTLPADKLEKRLSLESTLEDLDIISDSAALIMRIKEDLIGPAREQAPRPTMVDDVLKDAISTLALPSGLINLDISPNLPLAVADPAQLNRVFANLIKNAYEAMEGQPKPRIDIKVRPDLKQNLVLIDVADHGTGIPAADMDKIWVTFHTTKGIKGHTGLGLPACRLILEQIGGSIAVTSRVGEGSTFTVSLPLDKNTEAKAKLEPGKGKILLVDDDDSWRQFASVLLKAAGYKVTVAAEDYSTDNYSQYDLILIDDILAEGDSLAIMQAIAAAGAISKTVAVSSNPRVERTKVRMLLGLHNLLPKPYTPASLLDEVKKALEAAH